MTTPARPVVAVAFDLMDTLIRDPYREALEVATGRPLDTLFALRDASRYPAFECGEIDEGTYWDSYREVGVDVDVAAFHRTRRAGYRWLPGMRDLLADLAGEVERIIASNYPHWIEEVAVDVLHGHVDRVVASYDLGARKPDPDFFARLLARLDLPAAEVAFVDDRQVNVDAALAVGMPAHRFEAVGAVRAWLADLGVRSAAER